MIFNLLRDIFFETFRLFIEISPYLILGFLFAGLIHILIGERYIKKHFSKSGIVPTVKAAIFGIPLPVCSCGVIPLAESLRKDGASKSSTMAFLVSTPSSGIDSILATYALLGPVFAIFRPIASLISGTLIGIITHFNEKKEKIISKIKSIAENNNSKNSKSIREAFNHGFKVIPSEIANWLVIGVLIGGAISALVPADFGVKYLHSPFLNYAIILLISIPIYICATGSIPIAASLIAKGVLPGAALALLIAGPATNTVTISFVYKRMGKKITFLYILSIIAVSVAAGLFFDLILIRGKLNLGFISGGGKFLPQSIKVLSAVVLVFIFINSKFDLWRPKMKENKKTLNLKVPDMTCQHCKVKITDALNSIPDVKSVSIDLKTKEVMVETEADKKTIIDKIKKEGYNPE